MRTLLIWVVILFASLTACKKEEERTTMTNDVITHPVTDTLGKGVFKGEQHSLSGKAILLKENTANVILRLEQFYMSAVPDAHVYLSKTNAYSTGSVLKVSDFLINTNYNNSNITIDIADNINVSEYNYVIVWCTQYGAYFGSAPLE
ncbi:MAG: DM13 domain-containing protein [Cytophagales bacterium]|nr:DM13 domain-containing protein [Cytophaga sp.]